MKEFIKKAYKHRIESSRKRFFIGILIMIVSWQLIAFGMSKHILLTNSFLSQLVDFSTQMFLAICVLFFVSIINGIANRKGLRGYRILKITRNNEVIKDGDVRHLSYSGRIIIIYVRALFAILSYFLFESSRVFNGAIDNSYLHGADALVYALIFGWWVDQRINVSKSYNVLEWVGMITSASVILMSFASELFKTSPTIAFEGVVEGLLSALTLSVIILISSIVVYHDSVIRIAFHNCLFGFISSSIVILFMIFMRYNGNFSEISNILHLLDLKSTLLSGITYALALLGFLQSYRFIEPVLIAILGNSLGVGTVVFTVLFNKSELNFENVVFTLVLIVGSISLGIGEWKKSRSGSRVY